MKSLFSTLLFTLLIVTPLLSETEPQPKYFEISSDTFPTDKYEIEDFLWSIYRDGDTDWRDVYHEYKTENWMLHFSEYTNAILAILSKKGFDRNRLEKIFVQILMENHGQTALLPYAIYHLKTNTETYWIVHCAWEYPSRDITLREEILLNGNIVASEKDDEFSNLALIHIRMWAFRDSDLKLAGFATCM